MSNIRERRSEEHTDQGDPDEIPVLENILEDVELVVEPPAVDRVEDLGEDEDVEHESRHNIVSVVRVIHPEDAVAKEVENEDNNDLVD